MLLFPLYASLRDKRIVVVGGGEVAERKVRLMVKAGADVRIVSPAFSPALDEMGRRGQVDLLQQVFEPSVLDDAWFVIAATDRDDVNAQVARAAEERQLFVNVVDDPALATVHVPSIVNRSPLVIAISSAGSAPMVARHVREQMEALVDGAMGQLTALCQRQRQQIQNHRPSLGERRRFYEWLIRGPVLQHLRDGDEAAAEQLLEEALLDDGAAPPGRLVRIDVASDDAGDMTLRGLRALNQADIIFHDECIDDSILDLARRDASQQRFGTDPSSPAGELPEEIEQQLPALLDAGQIVVVLVRSPVRDPLPDRAARPGGAAPAQVRDVQWSDAAVL